MKRYQPSKWEKFEQQFQVFYWVMIMCMIFMIFLAGVLHL